MRHYDVDDPDGAVRVLVHAMAAVPRLARKGRTVPQAASGTLYRGREGMWSWVAHRVTGVLIFFFLFVHVLDTALVRVSPEAYNEVIATYKTPIVGLGEVGLVAAVLFHALNGLRIIAVDFWSKGPRYQRQMLLGRRRPVRRAMFVPFAIRHLMQRLRTEGLQLTTTYRPPSTDRRRRVTELHALPYQRTSRAPRQLRDVRLAVHARLRRRAGRPGLRPPVRQPHARRGHQARSTSPSSPASGPARSGRSGTC